MVGLWIDRGFGKEAQDRGFIHQCTDMVGLELRMEKRGIAAYTGFDPTAPSLHVGSLIQIMLLRLLLKHGHNVFILIGGGTAKIGDPSFREQARPLMDDETIEENSKGIKECLLQFFPHTKNVTFVNNALWLSQLNYLDLLRRVGKHFSVNKMLSFDSVKNRLDRDQGLTFLEFNYSVLQAYDFLTLSGTYDVTLQLGGSDQWGNIVSGVDLVRRVRNTSVFGLTTPLLTTANGEKMGKTKDGAIWLTPTLTSPYSYWQFWRDISDSDVVRFLKLFTELPLEEISPFENMKGEDLNAGKILLANEATSILYGKDIAQKIEKGEIGPDIDQSRNCFISEPSISVVDFLCKVEEVQSKSEARRLLRNGGVTVNKTKSTENDVLFPSSDSPIMLKVGKKKVYWISAGS